MQEMCKLTKTNRLMIFPKISNNFVENKKIIQWDEIYNKK